MAWTYRGCTTGTYSSPNLTLAVPSGIADGDLMWAVIPYGTVPAPTGWTRIFTTLSHGGTSIGECSVFQRVASSEPASYNFGNYSYGGTMVAFQTDSPAYVLAGFAGAPNPVPTYGQGMRWLHPSAPLTTYGGDEYEVIGETSGATLGLNNTDAGTPNAVVSFENTWGSIPSFVSGEALDMLGGGPRANNIATAVEDERRLQLNGAWQALWIQVSLHSDPGTAADQLNSGPLGTCIFAGTGANLHTSPTHPLATGLYLTSQQEQEIALINVYSFYDRSGIALARRPDLLPVALYPDTWGHLVCGRYPSWGGSPTPVTVDTATGCGYPSLEMLDGHILEGVYLRGGTIYVARSFDCGRTWPVSFTTPGTYTECDAIHHRGRLVVAGFASGQWYVTVGKPVSGGRYTWSGAVSMALTTPGAVGHFFLDGDTLRFAYLDAGGVPNIVTCTSLTNAAAGTWR